MLSIRGSRVHEQINEDGMTTWNDVRAAYNGAFIVDSWCAWVWTRVV